MIKTSHNADVLFSNCASKIQSGPSCQNISVINQSQANQNQIKQESQLKYVNVNKLACIQWCWGNGFICPFMVTLPSPHTFGRDHCNHSDVNSQISFVANLSMITYSCGERRQSAKSKPTLMSTLEMESKPPWERPMKMRGVRFHASLRVINCGVQTHTWMQKICHEMGKQSRKDSAAWCLKVSNLAQLYIIVDLLEDFFFIPEDEK